MLYNNDIQLNGVNKCDGKVSYYENKKGLLNFLNKYKFELAIMVFVFVYLYPILNSGFYYDDSLNSLIHGAKVNENAHISDYFIGSQYYWFNQGRVFPLGPLVYYLFEVITYTENAVFFYKLFIVLLTLVNVWLCGVLIEKISHSKRLKLFVMLVLPVFFQIAVSTFNALYSFHGLLQNVMLFGLLSLIFMVNAIDRQKKRYVVFSTIFMACSMLLYEVGFMFIFALFVVTYINKDKKFVARLKSILPQLIVFVLILLVNVYARQNAIADTYEGVNLHLGSIAAIIKTFIKQFSGSLPLTQAVAGGVDLIRVNSQIIIQQIICLLLFAVLAYFIVFRLEGEDVKQNKRPNVILLLIGFIFVATPCALISVSARYQVEVHFGASHLPVYAEWLGMAIITTVLFSIISYKIRKKLITYLLCVVIGLPAIFININTMNAFFDDTRASNVVARTVYENAINDGFYDEIGESDLLVFDNSPQFYALPNKDLFANYANRRIMSQDINAYLESLKTGATDQTSGTYFTKEIFYNANGGVILKGDLLELRIDGAETKVFIADAQLYIEMQSQDDAKITIHYNDYDDFNNYTEKSAEINLNEISQNGHIADLDSEGYIDLGSIHIE